MLGAIDALHPSNQMFLLFLCREFHLFPVDKFVFCQLRLAEEFVEIADEILSVALTALFFHLNWQVVRSSSTNGICLIRSKHHRKTRGYQLL